MTSNYETRELWTTGKRQDITCVSVIIYPQVVVATADYWRITRAQMRDALAREFPGHIFFINGNGGRYTLRADADRWVGDGLDEKKQESEK